MLCYRYLAKEDYSEDSLKFFAANGIRAFHFRLTGNKEPFYEIGDQEIATALGVVLGMTRLLISLLILNGYLLSRLCR